MDRKEFLIKFGKGTAAAVAFTCLGGCGESDGITSPPPQNVDFVLDLTESANSSLNNVGGSLLRNGIIIGRISETEFTAVSQACTHQGTTVQFQLSNNRFHCPNHGSNFSLQGNVINGPAASPLKKYNTELNENLLRVFG